MSNITSLIGKINGSMTSALSFENVKLNAFGCELAPTPAVSDYYTFCTGGSSVKDTMLPSLKKVENNANLPSIKKVGSKIPFVEPTRQGIQNLNKVSNKFKGEDGDFNSPLTGDEFEIQ